MSLKYLSEFYSDDKKRTAQVFVDTGPAFTGYHVSVKNDSGTSFTARFETVDDADDFAEDWVFKKE